MLQGFHDSSLHRSDPVFRLRCSEDLRLRGMLGGRTRPHDLGTLLQSVARIAVREFEPLLASPAGGELAF